MSKTIHYPSFNRKNEVESYENLIVWQKSMDLVILIYALTADFPRDEIYGLISQMRRAAMSISSNIAERSRRSSKRDFRNFLINAYGSGAELETQVKISKKLGFGDDKNYPKIESPLLEAVKMLNKLIANLQT